MNTRRKEDEIRDQYLQTGVFKKKNHTLKTFSDFFSLSYKTFLVTLPNNTI